MDLSKIKSVQRIIPKSNLFLEFIMQGLKVLGIAVDQYPPQYLTGQKVNC